MASGASAAEPRLPAIEGGKPEKHRFKACPIGCFHIGIAEVSTEQGKLRLLVGSDCTSTFAIARLVESAGTMEAARFLRDLIEAVPYEVHTVLTDNSLPPDLIREASSLPAASAISTTARTSSTACTTSTASSIG